MRKKTIVDGKIWKPLYAIWIDNRKQFPKYGYEGWAGEQERHIEIYRNWREAEKARRIWFGNYSSVVRKLIPYLGMGDEGPKTLKDVKFITDEWFHYQKKT